MEIFRRIKVWYRWGFWFDTPQGICVLLSLPLCWIAAALSFIWPPEAKPVFLSGGPVFFLFTPLLAFLYFVRMGQTGDQQYSSSWLTTIVVLIIIALPFYVPYLRS
jgi:uncharacterized RDD family membrane protein YckC